MNTSEIEPRWHRWSACEDPGGQKWRHGRAHARGHHLGYVNRPYTENRMDLSFGAEWRVLPKRSSAFGWGTRIEVGSAGGEHDLSLGLHASWLGDLWLHGSGFIPNRFKPKGYDDRVIQAGVSAERIQLEIWSKSGHSARSDPWWKRGYWPWELVLFGRSTVTTEVVEEGSCSVPMPEGIYPARYTVTRYTHTWRRLRPKRGRLSINIEPVVPIPVPGKGENSWDIDDDAYWSQSSPGSDPLRAVASLVESVTLTRLRYGGPGWVPDAGWKVDSDTSGSREAGQP